ncbi:hypothetical protein [Microbacterium sp. LWS13-1.2]|uniref:Uncharacterized protein n=1 Tax=Microbacterium sp. LWS13-1.2 TaxID=3135264 RepID=A0AAU6SH02_9MICO
MTEHVFTPSGPSIIVAPGIPLRPVVRGRTAVKNHDIGALEGGQEALVTFRLEYSEATGRFEVAAFGIDRGALPLEVSGALLRTVRVHAIAKIGILAAIPQWALELARLRQLHARGGLRSFREFAPSEDDTLLLTGLIYRIAEISGESPAQAVAESIGLKLRTATNWIQRARAAGYMTSTEHQKAARRVLRSIEPLWKTHVVEDFSDYKARNNITDEDLRMVVERENAKMGEIPARERT